MIGAQEIFPEFQIKRKEIFEFTKTPTINSLSNNEIVVEFEVKDFCDITIVIEDNNGKIVRHLASGVLGQNVPEPFQKDSLKQKIIWDKKNDSGKYIDNIDDLSLRVSLGLKPIFEKTLFWSPYKRIGRNPPIFTASPEGVFVFEGHGVDSIRQYNHEGVYEKTVYPFSKANLKNIKGLNFEVFPQDGAKLPIKNGSKHKSTLFVSGSNMGELGKHGAGAYSIAVKDKKIALASVGTSRITTNGESSKNGIIGPVLSIESISINGFKVRPKPLSVAFSNDGKYIYSTGYLAGDLASGHWLPVIMRAEYESQNAATVFIGSMDPNTSGTAEGQFKAPLCVTVDNNNNILVADYMNDRIQVFNAEGKFLKLIKADKPVYIGVHPTTNEIYGCSWMITNRFVPSGGEIPAQYYRIKSIDNPKVEFKTDLPLSGYSPKVPGSNDTANLHFKVCFDFWAKEPTIWILQGNNVSYGGWGIASALDNLKGTGITLYKEGDNKLVKLRDFNELTTSEVVRGKPPVHIKQRMFVCPITGMLYIAEGDSGVNKSFKELVSINPNTNETKIIKLPFTAEDACIDLNGYFCLRTEFHIVRYDPKDWREIPFDYGIEYEKVGFDGTVAAARVISAIELPATGKGSAWWHLGGMGVAPNGDIVVSCFNHAEGRVAEGIDGDSKYTKRGQATKTQKYAPQIFPGRQLDWEIHIWDKYGKPKVVDAFPGVSVTNGINIDKDDNLYVLIDQNRMLGDKPYFLKWNNTLVKVKSGKGKIITESKNVPLPIAKDSVPNRKQEISGGWIDNAEWLYGGVGFSGWRTEDSCICWNARPALDLLARSFVPEVDHFSVAVLDSNGNLILRVGQYGNVDDGKPLIADHGPKNTTSIGGDEVALYHAPYLSTFSDKRLFISDGGNSRILSVKMDYHVNHNTKLKNPAK